MRRFAVASLGGLLCTMLFASAASAVTEELSGDRSGAGFYYFIPSDTALPSVPGLEVVEEYDSFRLVSSPVRLPSPGALAATDLGTIHFATGARDPLISPRPVDDALPPGAGYYYIQLDGPIKPEWRSELEGVGVIQNYFPNNAFLIRLDGSAVAAARSLPHVRWVGHYAPEHKLSERILAQSALPATARDFDRMWITHFRDSQTGPTLSALRSAGSTVLEQFDDGMALQMIATAPSDLRTAVDTLAAIEGVYLVSPYYPNKLRNDQVTWVIQTGTTGTKTIFDKGIKGEGQIIGNADGGADVSAPAFVDSSRPVQQSSESNPLPPDNAHRKVVNRWDFGGSSADSHGTATASINAGGEVTPHQYDGMAPNAKLSIQAGTGASDISRLFRAAYGDGARFHSDSWGNDNGRYDAWSVQLDKHIWDNPDMIIMIAVANQGPGKNTISSPESAKNCIAVGASAHPRDGAGAIENMESYSARGPAQDGRLRPTLMAPSRETAARPGSGYGQAGSGTSFATPALAGGMALLRQYYTDGFYPSGKKSAADAFVPSAALMKATAVNSGKEMTGSGAMTNPYKSWPYPNVDQGWGRMTLDDALFFEGDKRMLFAHDETSGLATGASKDFDLGVGGATEPLEITLVWSDYPGVAGAGPNIVNDLNLVVTSPSGKTYLGNNFVTTGTPHQSQEGGTADNLNNEEAVLRFQPETGVWKIRVTALNVPQGPQKFGLVATGELAAASGVTLVSPTGGEMFKGGVKTTVQWASTGALQANSVKIDYTTDNGTTWQPVASAQPLNGTYDWTLPLVDARVARLQVEAKDAGGASKAATSRDFAIDSTPPDTKIGALAAITLQPTINLTFTATDTVSGVASVDLQYRFASGAWTSAGSANNSPFPFTATGDGQYDFQSLGTDRAGWKETAPAQPDATTLVDLAPPSVTGSTPAKGAVGVKIGTQIVVKFSEAMDRATVKGATSFKGGNANVVSIAWANGTDETMTVTPDGLNSGVSYTLVITAAAKDRAGRALAPAPYELAFTMEVETVPPQVLSTVPTAGASGVLISTKIEIEFSEPMKQAVTKTAVTIAPSPTGNWSWSGNVLKLSPASPGLKKDTTYKVTVSASAQDLAGNALPQPYEFSFATESAGGPGGPGGPGVPPLFSGGLLGFGLVGDLLLLIVLLLVVAVTIGAVRKRRRKAPTTPFYDASAPSYGPMGGGPGPEYAPRGYGDSYPSPQDQYPSPQQQYSPPQQQYSPPPEQFPPPQPQDLPAQPLGGPPVQPP